MEDGIPASVPEETPSESVPSQGDGAQATGESLPSSPPSEETTAPVEVTPPKRTKADVLAELAEFGDKVTHDDYKAVPSYNKRLMQSLQQQQRERQREDAMAAADGWFESATPEQLKALQNDDEYARANTGGKQDAAALRRLYSDVQEWKQVGALTGSGIYERVSHEMFTNITEFLGAHADFPDLGKGLKQILSDLQKQSDGSRDDIAKFLSKAIEVEVAPRVKAAKAQLETEYEAKLNEAKAQLFGGQDQPEHLPAGAPSGNGVAQFDRWLKDAEYRKTLTPAKEAEMLAAAGVRVG